MDKTKLVKLIVAAWKDGNSQYHNTKGSIDYDADLECFLEDCEDEINEMCGGIYANASDEPSINYDGVLGTVDSDTKEETDKILTAILYKHTCNVEMCVNEIDYEDVVKDIRQHFFQ